jgi:superfamily II DNA/RNA helicase
MKFSDLELDPKVLKALEEAGYETPTPIQEKAIPVALQGRDVLGIAQTGTGKTAAFTLPMITILSQGRARARMPRSLILCPTRELAAQVAENFETYGKYHKLTMALLIGGVSFKDQDKKIDRGVDVLIATPGRLLDHHERGKLMLTGVQVMVVDEADRMLDMGFIPDIERIFNLTPFTRQTLFFSATMPAEITRLTEAFLHNPERIEVARQSTASETIEQMVCMHTPKGRLGADKEKRDLLQRLIEDEGDSLTNAIVFCNRKRDVDVVMKALKKGGMNAAAIHGDLEQSERMRVLAGFRDNQIRIMVASDVAARGLDIPTVSHVYNYDVPIHAEDYVHRIGRTGRAGRWGKSITLCFPHEQKHLEKIEELLKLPIKPMVNPLGGAAAPEAEAPAPAPTSRRRAPAAAKASPAAPEPAPVVEQAAETVVEAVAAPAPAPETADAEPKRKRTRAPSRRRKTEDVTEVETPPAAAETVAEAPAAAVEAAPEAEAERPARAPRVSRRRARNKAEETTEAAPEATVDAPAPETAAEADAADAQPAPSRRSRGGRGGRTRGEPRAEAKAAPKPEPRAETKPAPKAEPQVDAKPEPRHESRAEQSRAPAPRGDQRGDQRGGNRVQTSAQTNARRDRGGRIIGMGDHVPAFMQQEIDVQALIRASSRADDKDEVAPASDAA